MSPSAPLYPLRFHPIFRQYIWGGRRLGEILHKPIGAHGNYAESWEMVDHGQDQSVVSHGTLAGCTLNFILRSFPSELLGHAFANTESFPLLLKLLDCNRDLSIQVHPSDEQARQLNPPDRGKTEAWYILDSQPDSCLYAGLRAGCTAEQFQAAIAAGNVDEKMRRLFPQPGQVILIPAGTVHALGQGLLVAEIQQSSDTTFRLFDWNRVTADGKPRALHIHAGLAVADWSSRPNLIDGGQSKHGLTTLLTCTKFQIQRRALKARSKIHLQDRFRIVLVVRGTVDLTDDPAGPMSLAQSALLPAALGEVEVTPHGVAELLEISLP